MDYITLKHDITELDKQASDWQRKLELLQVGPISNLYICILVSLTIERLCNRLRRPRSSPL